jgi:hypothetical protein
MNSKGKSMPSPSNWRASAVATAFVAATACDFERSEQEQEQAPHASPDRLAAPPAAASAEQMVYEDEDEFAILNDRSNLRPPDMSVDEYRRLRQRSAQEELKQTFPEVSYPTQDDIDLLSLRWFAQGNGVVAQNQSARAFSVAAHFTYSVAPSCQASVPSKTVGPAESAMLVPDDQGCEFDHATLIIDDEYGFFVDSVSVEPSEAKRR